MGQVKLMNQKDYQEMFELVSYAFNFNKDSERQKRFEFLAQHSDNYGYFQGEQLTSQIMATPFIVNLFGKEFKMAGIGFVASYPEFRGQGGINQLMEQALKDMREDGTLLSYLAPFSYPFYRRYGYEQVFERLEYRLAAEDWPKINRQEGTIIRGTWEEVKPGIMAVYQQNPHNHRGGVRREDWWYDYNFSLKSDFHFAVYQNQAGEYQGYVIYRFDGSNFIIHEWAYLNLSAFKGLAGFIASHNGAFKEFSYEVGYDGADRNYLLDKPFAKRSLRPEMMARIVDVIPFIEKYPFPKKATSVTLEVTEDKYGPWNTGTYLIEIRPDGKAIISKMVAEAPDITIAIQQLTQLLMGYQSIEELVFFEKITVAPSRQRDLSEIFAKPRPILEDYF